MKTRRTPWLCCTLALLPLFASSAQAHDIWLQADDYFLEKGDELIVRQLVGEELGADSPSAGGTQELAVLRDMTPGFTLVTDAGTVDLLAELPDVRTQPRVKPVLGRTVESEGLALVTMDHAVLYTEFTRQEFFEYLEHEGLEVEHYREHMGTAEYQGEGYQRTLKSLVRVGSTEAALESDLHAHVAGQPIEIVLLQNPYALDPGAALEVKVLLHGEPLAGQGVKAYSAGEGGVRHQVSKTDTDGVATFAVDRAGLWLVRLVHMAPCSQGSGVDCEDAAWESYWTAYTFAVD